LIVRTLKQPVVGHLVRGILIAAVSACSLTAWAQNNGQGTAAPPAKSSVAPPPADLEPGVNTSATQTSSPEPVPAPAPALKPAQTSAKRVPASPSGAASSTGASAAAGTTSAGATSGATADGTAGGAGTPAPGPKASASGQARSTTATPSSAAGATAGTPKPGAPAGKAHDSIQLDTTQITGNRELPKVLYIVPWKRSDLGDLVGKPVNSLLDEVLTPVDRDVFKRQNRYYDALKPDDAKDAAGAAAGVNEKH
jgi:hypothetical protein